MLQNFILFLLRK